MTIINRDHKYVKCESEYLSCKDESVENRRWADASGMDDIGIEAADAIRVMKDDFRAILDLKPNEEITKIAERHIND